MASLLPDNTRQSTRKKKPLELSIEASQNNDIVKDRRKAKAAAARLKKSKSQNCLQSLGSGASRGSGRGGDRIQALTRKARVQSMRRVVHHRPA